MPLHVVINSQSDHLLHLSSAMLGTRPVGAVPPRFGRRAEPELCRLLRAQRRNLLTQLIIIRLQFLRRSDCKCSRLRGLAKLTSQSQHLVLQSSDSAKPWIHPSSLNWRGSKRWPRRLLVRPPRDIAIEQREAVAGAGLWLAHVVAALGCCHRLDVRLLL